MWGSIMEKWFFNTESGMYDSHQSGPYDSYELAIAAAEKFLLNDCDDSETIVFISKVVYEVILEKKPKVIKYESPKTKKSS